MRTLLPPLGGGFVCGRPKRIGDRLGRELVGHGMTIAEGHDDQALALVIVPDALGIVPAPIHVPNPISVNDFVGGTTREVRSLERRAVIAGTRRVDVARDA